MSAHTLQDLDGRIGEALAGSGPESTHVNLVFGARGSATAAAISGALAQTAPGHAPLLACLGAGYAVRPATVVRNKTTLTTPELERATWGGVQLGIADGVMQAVEAGLIDRSLVDDLVLLVSVYVDPDARDQTALREANAAATFAAIEDAVTPSDVDALIARRGTAGNPFYDGR